MVSFILVITTWASGKLRESSVEFPSIEVSLSNGPSSDFLWLYKSSSRSCLSYRFLSAQGIFFLFFLFLLSNRVGQRKSGYWPGCRR